MMQKERNPIPSRRLPRIFIMTTAHRKFNDQNSGLPTVLNLLNPILDALRAHGGKANSDAVKSEVENKICTKYQLDPSKPSIAAEFRSRIERAFDLLNRAGFIYKEGINSLKLTSKALVVPKSAVRAVTSEAVKEKPMDIIYESDKVLPLPDQITLDMIEFLKAETQLTELQLEERILRRYAFDNGLMDSADLDEIRRRALTARRVAESKHLIIRNSGGVFTLSKLGAQVGPKQVRRITGISFEAFIRRQILKARFFVEERSHLEIRQHLLRELKAFFLGLGRYFTKSGPRAKQQSNTRL